MGKINGFVDIVRRFSNNLDRTMQDISSVTNSVTSGANEMRQGNSEILTAVSSMRDINHNVSHSITDIKIGAEEIEKMSELMDKSNNNTDTQLLSLKDVLKKFKIKQNVDLF